MNKKFNSTDKIELGLHNHVAEYYYLKYRFLPKKVKVRILWFYIFITVKDPWHVLRLYKTISMPEVNPDGEVLWKPVQINITDKFDVDYYKQLKLEISTYEELDKKFRITEREKQYVKDKEQFNLANSK